MPLLKIIMAIYESARMHEVVQLPLRTHANPLDLMIESGELAVERPGRLRHPRVFIARRIPETWSNGVLAIGFFKLLNLSSVPLRFTMAFGEVRRGPCGNLQMGAQLNQKP